MPGGLPGCCVKKLNQWPTQHYREIPDIGGQETCFFPGKRKKNRKQADGNAADSIILESKEWIKLTGWKIFARGGGLDSGMVLTIAGGAFPPGGVWLSPAGRLPQQWPADRPGITQP